MLAARRSPRLVTLMFGALFIYLVALIFHLPTLFFMASCLILAPPVSYWLAAAGLDRVSAERRLPPRLWPDEQREVELRIANHGHLPKALLHIDESLPEGLDGDPLRPPQCVVPMLWSEPFVHRYPLTARCRGRYVLPPPAAHAIDSFDLFAARRPVGPADEIVVYPRVLPLGRETLTGANPVGELPDRRTADGTDFRATREYRPGDELRRIHWPSTARLGKPIVVEYEEPNAANLFLVLDATRAALVGEGKDNTFETAVTVCASLLSHSLDRGSAVGLYVAGQHPTLIEPSDDRGSLLGFLEALALVEADGDGLFGASAVLAAELAPRGARVMLVSAQPTYRAGAAGELLAAAGQVARRRRGAGWIWLDPRGYRGTPPTAAPESFFSGLAHLGLTVYRVRREQIANGLAAPAQSPA
jgi:uncharacterized protein (DUF58 family)